jgi:uncharacterized protein (DUF1501 family)
MNLPRIATSTANDCSRRTFLRAGSLAAASLSGVISPLRIQAGGGNTASAVIQIRMSGGPSQLETFDPKPQAPTSVRGPFKPISTNVAGMQISELFPRLATQADKFAIVRSLHNDVAPVHEIGAQILRTGTLAPAGRPIEQLAMDPGLPNSSQNSKPTIGRTSVRPGFNSPTYGANAFGRQCQQAVHDIENGVQFISIEMFPNLYDILSWDCHANVSDLPTTLEDYRQQICPTFDTAISALLEDLALRGLLESTLVVCAGEFGRSPRLNARGGRDHWTGVWSALFAGGGVRGGQVIGSSDRLAGEPRDLPIQGNQIVPTMLLALGISARGYGLGAPIVQLF